MWAMLACSTYAPTACSTSPTSLTSSKSLLYRCFSFSLDMNNAHVALETLIDENFYVIRLPQPEREQSDWERVGALGRALAPPLSAPHRALVSKPFDVCDKWYNFIFRPLRCRCAPNWHQIIYVSSVVLFTFSVYFNNFGVEGSADFVKTHLRSFEKLK